MTSAADLLPHGRPAFALLTTAIRTRTDGAWSPRLVEAADACRDWALVRRLADRHALAPLLCSVLQRVCPEHVPPPVLAALREHARRNSALSALRWGTLLAIKARLGQEGIATIAYKGPAAALTQYGHVGLRQSSDLDIMVRTSDVWRAAAVLERDGFEPDLRVAESLRPSFLRDEYVLMFRRDDGRTLLELHWAVARDAFGTPLDQNALWARARTCALEGADVLVPSDEDQLVLSCIHAARHGWEKLEAVAGVAALASRPQYDWAYTWELAGRMHAGRMVMGGVQLAHGLFGTPLAPGPARPVRRGSLRAIVAAMAVDAEQPRPGWRLLLLQLRLKDNAAGRARQIVRQLLMPTGDDREAVRLPGVLSFAYPLVRIVRLVRKYGFTN